MEIDVSSYRRVAERWSVKSEDINPSAAAVLILQLCEVVERLQKADYEFQKKLMDGVTDAFLERRWIPVSERLPEQSGDYLVFLNDYQQTVMVMNGGRDGDDWYWIDDWDRAQDITHWMPLPEPPEVK